MTILSNLSQEESRSISENVKWGQRKKFSDGRFSMNYSHFLGYEKGPDGTMVVNEKQADVVRQIYGDFLSGLSPKAIAKKLTEQGAETPGGQKKWYETTEFDAALWAALVDTMTVYSKERIVFKLSCGTEIEV